MTGPLQLRRRLISRTGLLRARAWSVASRGVETGSDVRIGRWCRLIVEPGAHLMLGDACEVDDGTTLAVYRGASLVLGPGSFVGHHCTLAARSSITVGPGAYLAELVSVRDHDHDFRRAPSSGSMMVEPVDIGRHVWLGAKVTVLKGATVGEGAVIGANAVVHGRVPPYVVAVGVPARVIGPTGQSTEVGPAIGDHL